MASSGLTRLVTGAARKLFRPLLAVYYRLLYGRRFPLSKQLAAWFSAGEQWTGRGDVPLTKETWETQYRGGDWDFLTDRAEEARYRRIVDDLGRACAEGASVLDVGCGEGLLVDHLGPLRPSRYLGVDVSEAAVRKAAERADDTTSFVAADATVYEPPERFDAVVLNECLYYFDDPVAQFERYLRFTNPGGVVLLSMYESWRTGAILRLLRQRFRETSAARVPAAQGAWMISLFAPPRESR